MIWHWSAVAKVYRKTIGMGRTHRGVVQGNAIQFQEDLGLADGQQVDVVVHPISATESTGLSCLRWTISLVALAQIAVAIWWFASVQAHAKTATLIHLGMLATAGLWALRTRVAQRSHGVVALLNFYLAFIWGVGLTRLERATDVTNPWTVVAMTLAIIIPCVINGMAVLMLPRR